MIMRSEEHHDVLTCAVSGKQTDEGEELSSGKYVFGLGSNCGDRVEQVSRAIAWLSGILSDMSVSDIYETPAYGHAGAPYMNAVVIGRYMGEDEYENLEQLCKEYERINGRDAEARKNNRVPIDIDIVMKGCRIIREADFSRSFFQKGYRQIFEM